MKFALKPSRKLALAIVAAHAVAGASAFLVLPGAAGPLAAAALLALGLAAAWSRAMLGAARSVRAIEIEGEKVSLELTNGDRFPADIGERRHVSRLMVTLPARRPLGRTILVTADMLGSDLFRALRIWALWGRLPRVAGKQLGS